ncbi:glutathione peroxidase [Sphingobacterium sp. lm-10]|uniref:glutathione peroxidase n=1 Tax=Sphingobacterium sp. lm-10 TaxID=2944904 RepID=UPI0020228062|nr:glutathione peroxidase [Sphingobacterium sp. lm-10]MCL7987806.1 glutathione peroxidase [Sphingobacterium sp. lm-10]
MMQTFYDLSAHKPNGETLAMDSLRGQVVLIVNTATKCGLAPQFEGLEKLHQKYGKRGLVVLGFPCDQFGNQEPETDQNMETTCQINHGVTFQLMAKSDVNGADTNPIFQYLKKNLSGFLGARIKWNFTKFLVDKNGKPVKRFSPITKPQALEAEIQKLL